MRVHYLVLSFLLLATTNALAADAQTPSISGNGWVALGIIGALIIGVILFVLGALKVEERDARLHRRDDDAAVGILEGVDDDDDAHLHHH